MDYVWDIVESVRGLVPALWGGFSCFGLFVLLLGHVVDLSILIPTTSAAFHYLGEAINGYDFRGQCNMCGVITQMLDNDMLIAYNPYYGMRTTHGIDDDELAKFVNTAMCRKEPCLPGCEGLADAISVRVNTEAYNAFNRTMKLSRAVGVEVGTFASQKEMIIPAVINRDSQLLEVRFTSGRLEEHEYESVMGGPFDGEQPRSATQAARHQHVYDDQGVCVHCGRVRTTSECRRGDTRDMLQHFIDSRAKHSAKQPCTSCGIVQDFQVARPMQESQNGGAGTMDYSTAWFLQYPLNPETHKRCYRFCEGRLRWNKRLDVAVTRFMVQHRFREKLRSLYEMPVVPFVVAVIAYCGFVMGPLTSINGNLIWRNTLRGLPVTAVDVPSVAATTAARTSRNSVLQNNARLRGRKA